MTSELPETWVLYLYQPRKPKNEKSNWVAVNTGTRAKMKAVGRKMVKLYTMTWTNWRICPVDTSKAEGGN